MPDPGGPTRNKVRGSSLSMFGVLMGILVARSRPSPQQSHSGLSTPASPVGGDRVSLAKTSSGVPKDPCARALLSVDAPRRLPSDARGGRVGQIRYYGRARGGPRRRSPLFRDFQRQKILKPMRCQRKTVSGCTMARAWYQQDQADGGRSRRGGRTWSGVGGVASSSGPRPAAAGRGSRQESRREDCATKGGHGSGLGEGYTWSAKDAPPKPGRQDDRRFAWPRRADVGLGPTCRDRSRWSPHYG